MYDVSTKGMRVEFDHVLGGRESNYRSDCLSFGTSNVTSPVAYCKTPAILLLPCQSTVFKMLNGRDITKFDINTLEVLLRLII